MRLFSSLLLCAIAAFAQTKDTSPRALGSYTVATLPAAASWSGYTAVVTDASTAGSCTVGGGSALSLCRSSGAAWETLGGGGTVSAGTGITVVGSTVSADTAVMLSRATAQAGTSQYCRSTTGNDTYTCSLTPSLTAYTTGGCLVLNAGTANTGAATLNVDTLGAKSILTRAGAALSDGDITADKPITVCYDGTQFIIQGDGGGSSISVSGPYLTVAGTSYLGPGMYAVSLPSAETWVDPDTSGGTFTSLTGGGRQLEGASNSSTVRNRSFARGANTTFEFAWTVQGQPDSGDATGMRAGIVIRETSSAAARLMFLEFPRLRDDSSGVWQIAGGCFSNSTTYAGSDFIAENIPAPPVGVYYARLILSGGNWTLFSSSTGLASTWVQMAQWSATACAFGAAGTNVGIAVRNSSATAGSVYMSLLSVSKS